MGTKAFQHLLDNITIKNLNNALCRVYVVENLDLMNNRALCQALQAHIKSFEAIHASVHRERISAKRRSNKIHNDW